MTRLFTPAELEALALSLEVSLAALAIVGPLGVALGWLLARRRFPGSTLLEVMVHLPLVLTPVVVGYVLLLLFGRRGLFGPLLERLSIDLAFGFEAAVMAAATMALPLVVRTSRAAFELVDPGLEQAAAVLGAPPWRRFLTVTLPLASPGVVAGLVLGLARSLGEFGATITFAGSIAGETRTLPLAIHGAIQAPGGEAAALRMTALSLGISFAALFASEAFLRHARRRRALGEGGE